MAQTIPFTIDSFYKFISEGKVMAAKCNKCGSVLLPPKPVCPKCLTRDMNWIELKNKGKLLTYTVIHVSPIQFQSMCPYVLGIVKLEDGPNLIGMIRGIDQSKVKVGMSLTVDFDKNLPSQWPTWPRYFFKP
jgi:uncharacterized OB-fold protein